MKKSSIIVFCAAAVCAAAAAAIAVSRAPRNVDVADVTFGDFTKSVEVTGKVTPLRTVSIVAKSGGKVSAVSVKEGQKIRAGDPLLELDKEEIETALAQAKKELEGAKAQARKAKEAPENDAEQVLGMEDKGLQASLERSNDAIRRAQDEGIDYQTFNKAVENARDAMAEQTMAAQDDETDAAVEAANLKVRSASDRVKELETALGQLTLSSEEDGMVIAMHVSEGDLLQEGGTILQIAQGNKLSVVAQVEISQLRDIKVGQRAQIWQDERMWKGTVVGISPTVMAYDESVKGEVEILPDEGFSEFIGDNLDVSIITEQAKDVCMIPVECVFADASGSYVLAVAENRLEKRPVTVGLQDEYNVVIQDGLQVGEQAALFPEELLDYGGRIRPLS